MWWKKKRDDTPMFQPNEDSVPVEKAADIPRPDSMVNATRELGSAISGVGNALGAEYPAWMAGGTAGYANFPLKIGGTR